MAGRRWTVHHVAARLHRKPAHRKTQSRHLSYAGLRRAFGWIALADPKGRRVSLSRGGEAESVVADRKSTRLNSSHSQISYAVFCLKKKKKQRPHRHR